MAWQKKSEHINLVTGMHVVKVHNPETGTEAPLQVMIGHESCPLCGHVMPKTNLGEIDTPQMIADEIALLNQSHANIQTYAQKHRVQIQGARKR